MTVEGTAFRCSANTDTPCAGCGDIGIMVWLAADTNLCFECRKKGSERMNGTENMMRVETPKEHPSTADLVAYLEMGRGFVAEDQEGLNTASEVLVSLKATADSLEAEEKRATAPMNESLKVVRGWFAPARKAVQDARTVWDAALRAGREKMRLQSAQAAALVREAVTAGDSATAAMAHKLVNLPQTTTGTQVRKVWRAIVINPGLLTEEYLLPNLPAINTAMRDAVRETGEPPVIPGVKFEQVEQFAVRS